MKRGIYVKKVVVIYWSGTGNTELMANALADGANINDNEVRILRVEDASKEDVVNADAVALGCPSMGAEVLEESFMEPFVESLSDVVSGKPVALFGSYDWGDGEWMIDWVERMNGYGANLIGEGLIIHLTPEEDGINKCKSLGQELGK
nr:flavodoxin [Sporosalibacterium faouarense]